GYLIVFDRFAAFKIGGGRSQPEMHGYFRPSLGLSGPEDILENTWNRTLNSCHARNALCVWQYLLLLL
ncbi:hypothetical protein ACQKEM_14210, partial [Pseudomonas sp. NPDC077382]